ncbi:MULTISPECIES: glycosyltransferase family 2 protein [Halorussus]|uniref:glycosyltransferase family 2 protein n=1 Tax=Halorussus TaxID=1070314 RepID=UPI000E2107E9|nr:MULTISPECIES: glycosyltransferase family 2 protein [Halorussus]NHN61431.1 glycosyltransferase [Halorussus sp. JP-T4]
MGSMNEDTKERHHPREISTEQKRLPAISIVASEHDLGAIARTILRANRRGFVTFVALSESGDSLAEPLAEQLGGFVVEMDSADADAVRDSVERISRALGFPGLLHVEADAGRVDFSRCEEAAARTDGFGIPAPELDGPNRLDVEVLAAIPAYNEGSTVGEVVSRVRRHVDEVVVVDDGSDDDTVAAAERAGATTVCHETNRGYGAALQTAFAEADRRNVDSLVILDGDGQHDPDDIPDLVGEQRESGANVVVGSRFHGDSGTVPRYRRLGLLVINVLTNLTLGSTSRGSWVSDTQSGFRAFDREAIRSLAADDTLGEGMSASTDILYHARNQGYDINEVGTTIRYEGEDTSTQNPLVHGLSLVRNILNTVEHDHPLTFFGIPGVAIVAGGVGVGYWAVLNYVESGTLPVGLVLLCIFGTFLGSLLSFTSVILHSVKTHMERLHERGSNE